MKPIKKTEQEIHKIYNDNKNSILAVLYGLVVAALKCENSTKIQKLPRLADCALWVSAAENGSQILEKGAFLEAYRANIENSIADGIDSSLIASSLLSFAENTDEWIGTASELLDKLNFITNDKWKYTKSWAQTPRGLSNIIKRYKPQFRKLDIEITSKKSHGRHLIVIKNLKNLCTPHTPEQDNVAIINEISGANMQ